MCLAACLQCLLYHSATPGFLDCIPGLQRAHSSIGHLTIMTTVNSYVDDDDDDEEEEEGGGGQNHSKL